MKRASAILITASLILTMFCLAGCKRNNDSIKEYTISADYPSYNSVDELFGKADIVIKGQVISSKFEMLDVSVDPPKDDPKYSPEGKAHASKLPYTIYKIKVTNPYKGDSIEGQTIELKCLGGNEYQVKDAAPIQENENYIFFMNKYGYLLNATQSVHEISDEKIIPYEKSGIEVSDLNKLDALKNK